jgi:two-component system, chemotaxis family, chemotaxis protein CheY
MDGAVQKRVLVADDDRSIREYLRFLLEQAGYQVEEAEDGEVEVRKFSEGAFDLVVTDISMPEKDGIEAIIEMRAVKPNAKIIAMSGVARSERLLEIAQMYRADRVIKKPFESEEFLTAVREMLA